MKPGEDNNYWNKESDSEAITETYTPTDDRPEDFQESDSPKEPELEAKDTEPIHWSANEYIHEEKNSLWFTVFALVVICLIAVDIFLFKSVTFSILVIVMAITVIIFSRRPPKVIDYTLSGDQGLYVSDRLYHFSEFKSFGIIKDRNQHSIMLIPVKRFYPGVSVYFPEEAGEKIVDVLGSRLPMETLKLDIVDLIVQKLRL